MPWTARSAAGPGPFSAWRLFNVWRGGSFTAVFLLAGINAMPAELFDYARLETAGAWQRFWRVTVPLLRPYFALAVFLSFTTAFADLANVWMLTGGRVRLPAHRHARLLARHPRRRVGAGRGLVALAGAAAGAGPHGPLPLVRPARRSEPA